VALHARRLELAHPTTGAPLAFEAPLPADMRRLLEFLR
jgi:23S rRNA-/tRNA-specific pseudouridylate synthase